MRLQFWSQTSFSGCYKHFQWRGARATLFLREAMCTRNLMAGGGSSLMICLTALLSRFLFYVFLAYLLQYFWKTGFHQLAKGFRRILLPTRAGCYLPE